MRSESLRELGNQCRVLEGRRVDRDLVRAFIQYLLGVGNGTYATRDAKWYVEYCRYTADPAAVDRSSVGACRDVVEDELVGAFLAVAPGELDDVAYDSMISELDAFDDNAVTNVKARDYAFCWNDEISSALILPSRIALPLIAAGSPASRSRSMSSTLRTPPEACN